MLMFLSLVLLLRCLFVVVVIIVAVIVAVVVVVVDVVVVLLVVLPCLLPYPFLYPASFTPPRRPSSLSLTPRSLIVECCVSLLLCFVVVDVAVVIVAVVVAVVEVVSVRPRQRRCSACCHNDASQLAALPRFLKGLVSQRCFSACCGESGRRASRYTYIEICSLFTRLAVPPLSSSFPDLSLLTVALSLVLLLLFCVVVVAVVVALVLLPLELLVLFLAERVAARSSSPPRPLRAMVLALAFFAPRAMVLALAFFAPRALRSAQEASHGFGAGAGAS